MKDFLSRIHPLAFLFFGVAIAMVYLGIITGFEHKVLHVIAVSGNVISGLLIQWKYGSDSKK
ncbi:MAG: hypothetical protein KAH54_04050 [Candidatus Sabulitectum sp.]|nr:hypothetical protein [Candidatus Sabulitectum sp.]